MISEARSCPGRSFSPHNSSQVPRVRYIWLPLTSKGLVVSDHTEAPYSDATSYTACRSSSHPQLLSIDSFLLVYLPARSCKSPPTYLALHRLVVDSRWLRSEKASRLWVQQPPCLATPPALPSGIFSRPCLCRVVRLARCAFALRPSGGVSNYVLAITHYCLCTQNIGSILRYYKPALWLHECRGGLSTIRAPMPPRAACPRTRPQIPWRAPHDHLVAT